MEFGPIVTMEKRKFLKIKGEMAAEIIFAKREHK